METGSPIFHFCMFWRLRVKQQLSKDEEELSCWRFEAETR